MSSLSLRIDGTRFRDDVGREVTIRGINCAADAKFPRYPDQPSHIPDKFFDGDNVSFVDRPFSKEEARTHLARLKRWGYNTIRYIFTWEAVEHAGPGKYDEDFIAHTVDILRMMGEYGFYVFMDPHQDVWSRFSGGSGAPLWTLYACGLNPEAFQATQAAFVHSQYPEPANYPKMIWSTNYTRLACQTLFTLFFGGKDFAPNAIIDGGNIQDYLTDHYLGACRHLAQRIHEAGDLENKVVIGWESMNEPNRGLISWQDVSVIPAHQKLQKGPSPTAWQAILLGAGRACEVDTFEFGSFGPYKSGRELIDPKGTMAWLPSSYDDTKYGWKRDPGWKLGECLWAQQGVWDPAEDKLLKKDYFAKIPTSGKKLDYEQFTNIYFMDHYRKYRDMIRKIHKDGMMFCQAPVLEIPPDVKGTEDDDPLMVFASHYYDGLTLLTKHWNRLYNVDVFGVLRGRYLSPAFAVKVGETAIRNCLRDQLEAIRQEGLKYMGTHPCVYTEIGIPYDMDDKYAYRTGDYTSQSLAMDANHYALEGSGAAGYTLWTYVAKVSENVAR
jgi:Cellulase (glycosyl hydrolase family 5)